MSTREDVRKSILLTIGIIVLLEIVLTLVGPLTHVRLAFAFTGGIISGVLFGLIQLALVQFYPPQPVTQPGASPQTTRSMLRGLAFLIVIFVACIVGVTLLEVSIAYLSHEQRSFVSQLWSNTGYGLGVIAGVTLAAFWRKYKRLRTSEAHAGA